MRTDNRTLYEIKDDTERYILILWSVTVLVASLTGGSVVLVATIRFKAIHQHKVIVTVMQHMAACDILMTALKVFPITLALIADQWILGEVLCHLEENIGWVCVLVTIYLTCAMTTLKLIIVTFPLKTGAWTSSLGHRICVVLWLFGLACCTPTLTVRMLYIRDTIHFRYQLYSCHYDPLSPSVPSWYLRYSLISLVTGSILSYTTLLLTSSMLLVVAKRTASLHGETLRWEGVTTVLLTVGVVVVSYLPGTVVRVTSLMGVPYSSSCFRATYNLAELNVMSNFFVYSLTMRSFREFLRMRMTKLCLFAKQVQMPVRLQELKQ